MTFPIKKRIDTELYIDRTIGLYIVKPRIRVMTDEGNQPVARAGLRVTFTLRWKDAEMRDRVAACLEMSFMGMWRNLE